MKRYDHGGGWSTEAAHGKWVLYEDSRELVAALQVAHEMEVKNLKSDIDALKAELALAKELLDRWYNDSDIPDSNCSCHISPPCGDCVNWGGLRETASETKKLLGVK